MCYYSDQLQRLDKNGHFPMMVQFTDGKGNKTNHMNLNVDSIDVFINYLSEIKNEMVKMMCIHVIYNKENKVISLMTDDTYFEELRKDRTYWGEITSVYVPVEDWMNEKVTTSTIHQYLDE